MKEYGVHFWDYGADGIISGETVINAVEKNFERIAKRARIGNVAGYRLAKVVLEYRKEIFGGKGGGVLSITAYGSDGLVGYDPETDEPKTTELWIEGVTPDELPEPDVTTTFREN